MYILIVSRGVMSSNEGALCQGRLTWGCFDGYPNKPRNCWISKKICTLHQPWQNMSDKDTNNFILHTSGPSCSKAG